MIKKLSLENFDAIGSDEPVEGNPNVGAQWATIDGHQLVGNGSVTNALCGVYTSHIGCLDVGEHEGKLLDGIDCSGKIFVRKVRCSCHKPSCPICYESWGAREAHKIEARLLEASKVWGLVEHLSVSVPPERYHMSLDSCRAFILKALVARGIVGGCMIFHFFRWNKYRKFWYRSPHFHVLGFIKGGFGKCRLCKNRICEGRNKEYLRCSGFNAVTRRLFFESDGVICKVAEDESGVAGERKSVFRTAQYQLSHASIKLNSKRAHAVWWFGVCSYRKLKVKAEKVKAVCPICNGRLGRIRYNRERGLENFNDIAFIMDSESPLFKEDFLADFYDDKGRALWEIVSVSSACKRGYDE